ncbi:MAG: FAD-dependent oxidoreductase [Thermomicrobiales bacterium]
MSEVVVIGGGVVGAAATYQLARNGHTVTLIDRSDDGQATAAGAGIISPGTGALGVGAFRPLAAEAVRFYPELVAALAEDGEWNTGYATCGALFIAATDEEMEHLPERLRDMTTLRENGMGHIGALALIDGGQARELFPPLADLPGAIHLSGVGRVDGRLMRDSLRRAARRRGATILEGDAEVIRAEARVAGVRVAGQEMPADAVIIAGGAWSNALGDALGLRLPIYPQRGQILHLDVPGVLTSNWPVITGAYSHYILAFPESRVVAGATREHDSGYDYRMTAGGVREALGEALRVAPGLATATLHEVRIGLRPTSTDGLPIMGQLPGLDNAYIATGHGASGLTLGPYSGSAVADLAVGKSIAIDLAPFAATRFQHA